MGSILDSRMTILQIFNEVRRKLGLTEITALDTQAKNMLDYLNDVMDEISSYGNWQEMLSTVTVTASTSISRYLVNTTASAVIKNIMEISFQNQVAALKPVTLEDIKRLSRTSSVGIPRQYAIDGVDNVTTGAPYIRVHPVPGTNENNKIFTASIYRKPSLYTTADVSAIPEFNSRMVVQGLLAKMLLDESRSSPGNEHKVAYAEFREMLQEEYNRFNGDTGTDTYIVPTYRRPK